MPPAARITDMHVCPMVTGVVPHVGGPITVGSTDVITGGLLQARVTDMCTCVGPPDAIAVGSLGVIVDHLCAARMTDLTLHGGMVVLGLPTVEIGEVGNPMLAIAMGINPLGGTLNCGWLVSAAIARIYGTNPTATAVFPQDGSWTQIGNRHGTTVVWGHTMKDAFQTVRNGGRGTTAIVGIDYGAGKIPHVVAVTNHYGTPVLIEGQNGGSVVTDETTAQNNYAPVNVGIGVLPTKAPSR
jgi:uncharacterized Zn-binding protein involved in type VI secretion